MAGGEERRWACRSVCRVGGVGSVSYFVLRESHVARMGDDECGIRDVGCRKECKETMPDHADENTENPKSDRGKGKEILLDSADDKTEKPKHPSLTWMWQLATDEQTRPDQSKDRVYNGSSSAYMLRYTL